MLMRPTLYIICILMLLLATSCGRQHDAESLVKDFMRENMHDYSAATDMNFKKIDSTRYLKDSIITNIRKMAETASLYKEGIKYNEKTPGKKLIVLRVEYKVDNKEHSDTYYMNDELTHIVAFKTN